MASELLPVGVCGFRCLQLPPGWFVCLHTTVRIGRAKAHSRQRTREFKFGSEGASVAAYGPACSKQI